MTKMGLESLLKIKHQTLRVEIEATSNCNARCVHCPRDYLDQSRVMTEETFEKILATYIHYRETQDLNKSLGRNIFPKFIFSGMGEPILNPLTPIFIRKLSDHGFKTKMYTNGGVLSRQRVLALSESGIDEVSVSFAGIDGDEFTEITKIKNFENSLANVLLLRDVAASAGINFYVTYNAFPQLKSNDEDIRSFWADYGITCNGPFGIWNRAGLVSLEQDRKTLDTNERANLEPEMWCSRLQFYDSITANGDFVYCCCTFGHPKMVSLGNIHSDNLEDIHRKYEEVLKQKDPLNICQSCDKPNETFFLDDLSQAIGESKLRL